MLWKSPDEIAILLRKLIRKIEQAGALMEMSEIKRSQLRIIFPIIREGKGYSMRELCEISGCDKAFVSRTIADVEYKGLIERDKATDSNERNYKIMLSEKGKELFAAQKHKAELMSAKMLNGVTVEELKIFVDILSRLAGNSDGLNEEESC